MNKKRIKYRVEFDDNNILFFLFAYWHDPRWKKFVGATVKIWDLAQNLSKLGHDVTLFLPKYRFDTRTSSVRIVEIPFCNLPFLRVLSFNLFLIIYLVSHCYKARPDVVYTRRMGSIVPGIYAKLINAIFFYEINDDPYRKDFCEGSLISFKIRKIISEWQDETNLKLCKRAFVITKEILNKILKRNPALQVEKFIELPSGANTDLFKPIPVRKCRACLNIDFKKKYIGFAGTLLKHQGVDILIDAARSILTKEPSSVFLIIGEGPMRKQWMNKATKEGIGKSFIFTGQVDYEDMPIWIGAMDICIAPFNNDTGLRSPVKIFDYMACGKPVVASRVEGTTDLFEQSEAIKLVVPGNAEILSKAIIDLLHNQDEADKMGKKGHAFIFENYDRKSIAKRISDEAISCKL